MNEELTKDMDGNRSFEERVFARFDALDTRLSVFETHLQALEEQAERRAIETKPIWERASKRSWRRGASCQNDLTGSKPSSLENRADLREAEERIENSNPSLRVDRLRLNLVKT